jgi:hypothetical protein
MPDAAQYFSAVEADFRQGVESRRKAIEQLAAIDAPYAPTYVMLNTPFLIWALRDGTEATSILLDSHIESGNNWAKVYSHFEDGGDFYLYDQLGFYFFWENTTGADAVVNLTSYLMLNGGFLAHANPGWIWSPFWGEGTIGTINLSADVELSLWEWWNQPPTEPLRQADQIQSVSALSVDGGYALWSPGKTETSYFSSNYHVNYDTFRVPNNEVAVLEVTLKLTYEGYDADGWFDFDSDNFLILCPYLQLEIVSPPPTAVA